MRDLVCNWRLSRLGSRNRQPIEGEVEVPRASGKHYRGAQLEAARSGSDSHCIPCVLIVIVHNAEQCQRMLSVILYVSIKEEGSGTQPRISYSDEMRNILYFFALYLSYGTMRKTGLFCRCSKTQCAVLTPFRPTLYL